MSRLTVALLTLGLLLLTSPASAYVWRCNTPNGYVWTSQPGQSGDCEEYDGTFNPSAAPPTMQSAPPQPTLPPAPQTLQSSPVQYAPPLPLPAPPVYGYPYPYPYPAPYYYPYYPYYRGYYRSGVYLGVPPFVFGFGLGHGPHFGGHRFRRG